MEPIEINGRKIGPGYPAYIIAEMSANHHQDYGEAVRLVKAAQKAGADAVKLQTYTPDTLTIRSDRREFRIGGGTLWDGQVLYDLYRRAYMPWEWQPKLKKLAESLGIALFSTAYDTTSADFLEAMGVPAYKIASFEIVDTPLIRYIAGKGKPVLIATGMATRNDIKEAVNAAKSGGAKQIALLKCTSAYPAPPAEMNLRTIPYLSRAFKVPVGLSDHTLGVTVPVAAVTLGACIVEKHFTFSRKNPGADSAFSLEPDEFQAMVEALRTAEQALGKVQFKLGSREKQSYIFRRSLYVVKDMKAGEVFTQDNVRSIRPGRGLSPACLEQVLGKRAVRGIKKGTPLSRKLIS